MAATEHRDADERTEATRRRFITRRDVEDAAEFGRPIRLQPRDVITDEAAQRAADLGLRIERPSRSRPPGAAGVPPPASGDPSPVRAGSGTTASAPAPGKTMIEAPPGRTAKEMPPGKIAREMPPGKIAQEMPPGKIAKEEPATSDDQLRDAVRGAVVAELGQAPAGLDAAIDRVLHRRRSGGAGL